MNQDRESNPDWLRIVVTALVVMLVLCGGHAVPSCLAAETLEHSAYVGSLSCSSVSCHGRTESPRAASAAVRNEFITWMHTDPHARSATTMAGAKFQDILFRLGAVRDGEWDVAMYARCAKCHDPLPAGDSNSERSGLESQATIHARGIGCESCHGPAAAWYTKHYERSATPEVLAGLGMKHTKNLRVRGAVCASCHVGASDKDMNHDMIAAGHPALRFELTSYHDRLPKHWSDSTERLAVPHFAARLWVAGQVTSAAAARELSAARASRAAPEKGDDEASRPKTAAAQDFAEFNCLACHQRLRPLAGDDRHITSADSRPQTGLLKPSEWYIALASPKSRTATLAKDWPEFTTPDLITIVRQESRAPKSWEASCQLFLALRAADRTIRDHVRTAAALGRITPEQQQRLLNERDESASQLAAIQRALSFTDDRDWPRALGREPGVLNLDRIAAMMAELAEQMDQCLSAAPLVPNPLP